MYSLCIAVLWVINIDIWKRGRGEKSFILETVISKHNKNQQPGIIISCLCATVWLVMSLSAFVFLWVTVVAFLLKNQFVSGNLSSKSLHFFHFFSYTSLSTGSLLYNFHNNFSDTSLIYLFAVLLFLLAVNKPFFLPKYWMHLCIF